MRERDKDRGKKRERELMIVIEGERTEGGMEKGKGEIGGGGGGKERSSYKLDRVTPTMKNNLSCLARSYRYHDEHPVKKFTEKGKS